MSDHKKERADHERNVNAQVIKVLREKGDNPQIVRPVRHWIYPDRNPISSELTDKLREMGFVEIVKDAEGMIIEADCATTSEALDRVVVTLAWLCDEFGCNYDGCETQVTELDS